MMNLWRSALVSILQIERVGENVVVVSCSAYIYKI